MEFYSDTSERAAHRANADRCRLPLERRRAAAPRARHDAGGGRDTAERHGWDSALTETTLRQQTSRTLVSAIEAAVERDPDRAQSLRTRYAQHIEVHDAAALDALLSEAQTRQRAAATSAEILNATPPDGSRPTPQWRLSRAEAIADPNVRSATIRHLRSAAATDEARARTLAEQVLARVLKDGLTDSSQIPVREWVALDAERRQAIETRLDHNARGTEPAPNPALVDELASEMTQSPAAFARRDLIPAVAHLPLPRWQRFRDWQAGLRRNDPTTEDQLYAVKRGLQIATRMLPANLPDHDATNRRAALVEEIDTWRRVNGKSPTDANITDMLARHVPSEADTPRTLEWDPRDRPEFTPARFAFPRPDQGDRPGIHRVQDANRAVAPSEATLKQIADLMAIILGRVIRAKRALVAARAHLAAVRAAARAIPAADVIAAAAAARAIQDAMRMLEATAREHADALEYEEYVRAQISKWGHTEPAPLIVESKKKGESATPKPMTPAEKDWQGKVRARQREREALRAGGVAEADLPPELPPEDPEERARREQEEAANAEAARVAEQRYRELAKKYDMNADSEMTRRVIENLDMDLERFCLEIQEKLNTWINRLGASAKRTHREASARTSHRRTKDAEAAPAGKVRQMTDAVDRMKLLGRADVGSLVQEVLA